MGVRRLSPMGAELLGLDAAALKAPGMGALLRRAILEHQLVVVRGLALDALSFRATALGLGPLRPVAPGQPRAAGLPDIHRLTNLGPDGAPSGAHPDPSSQEWHTDGSALRIPSRFTMLYSMRVPDAGGETSFADMYASCAALPADLRGQLLGQFALHDVDIGRFLRRAVIGGPWHAVSLARGMIIGRGARHPVIREHEDSGRASLFLGVHAWRLAGRPWLEGRRLLKRVNAFATSRPEWLYTHRWRLGDLLIWDNRCVLHRGHPFDASLQARDLLRAIVEGEAVPVAARA